MLLLASSSAMRAPLLRSARLPAGGSFRMLGGGFGAPAKKDSFRYTGKLRPGRQSARRVVPSGILLPDYAVDGKPKARGSIFPWQVEVKSEEDIKAMRAAGRIAREVLDIAGSMVQAGVTTDEIDARVHQETIARNAYPSPLNYHGFPKSCCTSVNEVKPTAALSRLTAYHSSLAS